MQFDPPTFGEPVAGLSAAPLFHAAWLFAVGIALTHWLWLRPSLVLAALVFIVALCGVAAQRAPRIAWMPLTILWCVLGAWCALMERHPAPAPGMASLSDGLLRTVEGTVVDAGTVRANTEQSLNEVPTSVQVASPELTQRVDLRVSSLEAVTDTEDAQKPILGGVRLTVRWQDDLTSLDEARAFRCGERVRANVRLSPPESYHDTGTWSREDFLVDQGITSTAGVSIDRVERLSRSRGPGAFLACRLSGLRYATTSRLLALPAKMNFLPAPLRLTQNDAIMMAAMVVGDRTYLTHSLRVGFERTGSFHILVVSGFHLAIVAGCILWAGKRMRLPRVPATLLTIFISFAYSLFTGFATPVQRSLLMVTLYLLGRLVYRERNAMNTIGFASLCLLAASPRSLFDSSLQMTLLAVIAIAGVAAPFLTGTVHPYLKATRDLRLTALDAKLEPRIAQFRSLLRMFAMQLQKIGHQRLAWNVFPWTVGFVLRLIELLTVSFLVELAMTLPMAIYFHRITLFSLPVNLSILPLLAVLMPAALLTLVLLFVWPALAVIPAIIVSLVLHLGMGLVHVFGSFTYGDLRISDPLLWQSVTFCTLLGTAIVLAHLSVVGRRHWQRHAAWVALVLASVAAITPRAIEHPRNALLVEAIDVGQGDSLLLITPDGKTLLVDGGGFGGEPRQAAQNFDIGEEVVSPALWARGIRHLDAVALSHAHSDHMGGLPAVLRNFHPDELWIGNNPRVDAYNALLDEAAKLHVQVKSLQAGGAFTFGSSKVGVLAPLPSYQPGLEPANNDSLVLHVSYGGTSALLEGDAEAPVEQEMLGEADLQSTLLKVAHHGSLTSTTPAFLARVAPHLAVISCGLRNSYGHPRQEILKELQLAGVKTFRTDTGGAQCFLLDGKAAAPDFECGQ